MNAYANDPRNPRTLSADEAQATKDQAARDAQAQSNCELLERAHRDAQANRFAP